MSDSWSSEAFVAASVKLAGVVAFLIEIFGLSVKGHFGSCV